MIIHNPIIKIGIRAVVILDHRLTFLKLKCLYYWFVAIRKISPNKS